VPKRGGLLDAADTVADGRESEMESQTSTTAWAAAIAVAVLMALGSVTAEAGDQGLHLKLLGVRVAPGLDDTVYNDADEPIQIRADNASGYGLGLEYRSSQRLSWTVEIMRADVDTSLEAAVTQGLTVRSQSSMRVTPLLAGLEYHLTPGGAIDVSVGPLIGWVRYGDVTFNVDEGESVTAVTRNKMAYGARIGAEVGLGGRWAFSADVARLWTDLEASEGGGSPSDTEQFSFDPWIVTVGLGYRF